MSDRTRTATDLANLAWPQIGEVSPARMPELLEEARNIVAVARSEAVLNAFDAQPSDFGAALHRLAAPRGDRDE